MADFKSILIVDDEPVVGNCLKEIINFRDCNFIVTCKSDPLKALKLFDIYLPDILITDYEMPRANGLAVAARAREKNKSIPVLMVTGATDIPEDDLRSIKNLNIQIIRKPFSPDELYRWLDMVTPAATAEPWEQRVQGPRLAE